MVNLGASIMKLNEALKTLRRQWDDATLAWQDVVRQEFERDYLVPLLAHVSAAHQALEHFSQVLTHAHQDCG